MQVDFQEKMAGKTDEELQGYLDNYSRYVPEALEAVVAELKNRGHQFTIEETEAIEKKITSRREYMISEGEIKSNYDRNVVDDIDAPLFYSELAIYNFSGLFFPFAGAILLSKNIKAIGNKKGAQIVIAFGLTFTILGIFILNALPRHLGLTILYNGLGGLILHKIFWKKYLGTTPYRKKPVWKPLIICVAVLLALLAIVIYTNPNS